MRSDAAVVEVDHLFKEVRGDALLEGLVDVIHLAFGVSHVPVLFVDHDVHVKGGVAQGKHLLFEVFGHVVLVGDLIDSVEEITVGTEEVSVVGKEDVVLRPCFEVQPSRWRRRPLNTRS